MYGKWETEKDEGRKKIAESRKQKAETEITTKEERQLHILAQFFLYLGRCQPPLFHYINSTY